ncbi:40S ribosomal protein S5 [Spinacia oleracea]|uniref:40S ribosomal protein S5 n=1 Tax=Spinacia oleracea TaxID=3562 RepID=A0A9R0J349_SPIOL|nr:40S ribosomal protein S5 [Spinacia oleracea]
MNKFMGRRLTLTANKIMGLNFYPFFPTHVAQTTNFICAIFKRSSDFPIQGFVFPPPFYAPPPLFLTTLALTSLHPLSLPRLSSPPAAAKMAEVETMVPVSAISETYLADVKLFGKWSFDDVTVADIALVDYIGASAVKHATYVPHTAGRYQKKRFRKAQCPIVERLTNSLMMHGRNNGKKLMVVRNVKHALEIISLFTDLNPIQVIVDAIVNSGPREDATRIGSVGVFRRQAVDISPSRRVNQAIYLLTTGARERAFRNIKTIVECLADEIINAAKG